MGVACFSVRSSGCALFIFKFVRRSQYIEKKESDHMKNRWITMLLVLALICALLPQLALSSHAEGDIAINEANFPDGTFRSYVSDWLDRDHNGSLSTEELQACVTFDLYGQNITSLKGIEYFTSLCSLNVHGNQLTALDLSKNTALTELYCYDNQLTALDVSGSTALTELYCSCNQLTALDVSKNTALTELECYGNQLTALDVSKNTALEWLHCGANQLTALDVSKNTALERLYCYDNQLTALDVSKNTALKWLDCCGNQLTALDVSKNTALTVLRCYRSEEHTSELQSHA